MQGAGPYEGRVVDVTFGKAKAYAAALFGFVAPGASILLNELRPGGDGIQSGDLWFAGLSCIVFAAGAGGTVWAVRNKATVVDKGPA